MKPIHQVSLPFFVVVTLGIVIILNMINVSTSNPMPQFIFPQPTLRFSDDDRNITQSCLEKDYSMPYFNEKSKKVGIIYCTHSHANL